MTEYDGPRTEYTGMAETGIVVMTADKYTFQAMYPFAKARPSEINTRIYGARWMCSRTTSGLLLKPNHRAEDASQI